MFKGSIVSFWTTNPSIAVSASCTLICRILGWSDKWINAPLLFYWPSNPLALRRSKESNCLSRTLLIIFTPALHFLWHLHPQPSLFLPYCALFHVNPFTLSSCNSLTTACLERCRNSRIKVAAHRESLEYNRKALWVLWLFLEKWGNYCNSTFPALPDCIKCLISQPYLNLMRHLLIAFAGIQWNVKVRAPCAVKISVSVSI